MNYLVSYDLNKSGKNYDGVYEAIKSASNGVWCHALESVWIIQSSLSAKDIYGKVAPFIDLDDRLLVVGLTGEWWGCLDSNISDYLKKMT